MSNAFDKVNHFGLYLKLTKRRIPAMNNLLFLKTGSQVVLDEMEHGQWSQMFGISFGVRQGGNWKCENGERGTVKKAGVENARLENAAPVCSGWKMHDRNAMYAHTLVRPTIVPCLYINRGRYVHAFVCRRPCVAAKPRAAKPRVRVSRRSLTTCRRRAQLVLNNGDLHSLDFTYNRMCMNFF